MLALAATSAFAAPALGAPPPNDTPAGAADFQPIAAANGRAEELEAFAELAEATPDPGVPRCLGPGSFERTVWFRVPAAPAAQEVSVEASGRTLAVVDVAAFVQPAVTAGPVTRQPNACSGIGAGGADAAEEPTSGVVVRVPANRSVLIQVGRRGPAGSADDERALVSLDARLLSATGSPPGDRAYARTPKASGKHGTRLNLAWATTADDDPADPSCPALGTVWRHYIPSKAGPRIITVRGFQAQTLSVFAGNRPRMSNELDCVDRGASGALQMRVPTRRGRSLWIRVGADNAGNGARAQLSVDPAPYSTVVNGGPGGFDPTPGGPGGGLPSSCDRPNGEHARVGGPSIRGRARLLNPRPVLPVTIRIRHYQLCNVRVDLVGPRGRVYGTGRAIRLRPGRRTVRIRRTAHLRRGAYHVRVTALSSLGALITVPGHVNGKLK